MGNQHSHSKRVNPYDEPVNYDFPWYSAPSKLYIGMSSLPWVVARKVDCGMGKCTDVVCRHLEVGMGKVENAVVFDYVKVGMASVKNLYCLSETTIKSGMSQIANVYHLPLEDLVVLARQKAHLAPSSDPLQPPPPLNAGLPSQFQQELATALPHADDYDASEPVADRLVNREAMIARQNAQRKPKMATPKWKENHIGSTDESDDHSEDVSSHDDDESGTYEDHGHQSALPGRAYQDETYKVSDEAQEQFDKISALPGRGYRDQDYKTVYALQDHGYKGFENGRSDTSKKSNKQSSEPAVFDVDTAISDLNRKEQNGPMITSL